MLVTERSRRIGSPIDLLTDDFDHLLGTCIAWHVRPHRAALLEGLSQVFPELRLDGIMALELGATARSTLTPFLVALGGTCTASCYGAQEVSGLKTSIAAMAERYKLPEERLHVIQADVLDLSRLHQFDLIVMKSVLGGLSRQHDLSRFGLAVDNCLASLRKGGHLLVIDKARSLTPVNWALRRFGAAGRNAWHYFTRDELRAMVPPGAREIGYSAHGVLSFGDFGGGIVQALADFIDGKFAERVISVEKRVVFSWVLRRETGSG